MSLSPSSVSKSPNTKDARLTIDPLDFDPKDEIEEEHDNTCDEANNKIPNNPKFISSRSSRAARVLMLGTGGDS